MFFGTIKLWPRLMPAGAVADQYGVGAGRDLGADFLQMRIHRLGVGVGHDHGRADASLWADGPENVGGNVPVVAHHQRARADRRPYVGVSAFLTDAASSWNQISTGARAVVPRRTPLTRLTKFF